jgi:phosphoglycerol transferase
VGTVRNAVISNPPSEQTQHATLGKTRWKALAAYAGAAALSLLILIWVMRLWKADLAVPFRYGGDAVAVNALIKGLVDNGWYLHNRFLSLPTGLDFHDFPMAETTHFLLIKLISLWTSDSTVIINIYYLLTFPLTVVTSLFVFRQFKIPYPAATVGRLLFAFLPYHFLRGEMHLFLASYYLIPLMVMVVLWICRGELLPDHGDGQSKAVTEWTSSKVIMSIAICILVASGGVYYAYFAGFFLCVAGLFALLSLRSLRHLLAAGLLLVILVLGLILNLSPSIVYTYRHGKNQTVAVRYPREAGTFGMQIGQLLLPVDAHRASFLAGLKRTYRSHAPLHDGENSMDPLGIVGSLGFLILLARLIFRRPEADRAGLLDSLALLNLAGVLLATIGGFGLLVATFVTPLIRAYNRISIYTGFFSLFAVIILLHNLSLKWSHSRTRRCLYYGLLGVTLLGGILDQTTPALSQFAPPYQELKTVYAIDADFVKRIEASVPKDAMIFQLPHMPFPENPPVHHVRHYDMFLGYLHSKNLRWTYGAMRGRGADAWQRQIVAKPVEEMVESLAFAGFDGIYVDRYGYADRGAGLEAKLLKLLGTPPITKADQRVAFFNLAEFTSRLRDQYTAEEWRAKQDTALHILTLQWKDGFSGLESAPGQNWRWCSSQGELHISNSGTQRVLLEMSLATGFEEFSNMQIDSPWFSEQLKINGAGQHFSRIVTIPAGRHVIRFSSDARRIKAPSDPRVLVFRVMNFRWTKLGN